MAIYTDFFVASEDELRAAFPHRFPVADRPTEQEHRNPFTGELHRVNEWGPAEPFPELLTEIAYPNQAEFDAVRRLPLAQWKEVEQVKLAALQSIARGAVIEGAIAELSRPALVAPGDEDSPLFRLPGAWVEVVANIDSIERVAKAWAARDECRMDRWTAEDAAQMLESLRELAKRSLSESKGMFLWVNL